ncbi:MAG TPA: hypothetical protein VMJ75_05965 [Candidatus Acidoferrales bacterium]|nr:hypothetical protein [Candidatus Acidoferrales bacterium]
MGRILALALLLCLPALAAEPENIDTAVQRMYDFNFPASQEILSRYVAQHPEDPLPYAFRASAYLFKELDRMSILESEFLTDDNRIAEKKKRLDPDPATRKSFLQAVTDTESRSNTVLKANPYDIRALFAMSIAQGVATDYMAFVEKRQIASLSVAKRSNSYAQRLLKLDPKFYDAYLTCGISEYMVGSLPFFVKWFVHFDNIEGDKKRGVDRLILVAREGHYFKPFSKILLATIALREKRPRDAQRFLQELATQYPENPLFRKELDKLNVKVGALGN